MSTAAWLLTISIYGKMYFQVFDSNPNNSTVNWRHCSNLAEKLDKYFNDAQQIIQDRVFVVCTEK